MAAALALGLLASIGAASGAPVGKTAICHLDASSGVYYSITVADPALYAHLQHHGDGFPRGAVPDQPEYVFNDACVPSQLHRVNFDDVSLSPGTETGPLGTYAGFSWTKTYAYQPTSSDCGAEQYGYCTGSAPNIAFIGFPQDLNPVVAVSQVGDVSFTSVYLTNPGRSATDPDGPITVTITALDDGVIVGTTTTAALIDSGHATVPLDSVTDGQRFESVDTLTMSAGGKYFGFDDLTYYLAP